MSLLLLMLLSAFIKPGGKLLSYCMYVATTTESVHNDVVILFIATIYFTVQPGDTILALDQMSNVTFQCTCIAGDECTSPPFWSLENGGRHFVTNDNDDAVILAERGITYSSSGTSAFITIPDTMENDDTQIFCAGLISGGIEFSDPPVKLTIIGNSMTA